MEFGKFDSLFPSSLTPASGQTQFILISKNHIKGNKTFLSQEKKISTILNGVITLKIQNTEKSDPPVTKSDTNGRP